MKCPSCGEHNDGEMQFCIFCGSSLMPQQQQKIEELHQSHQPQSQSMVTIPNIPAASALVCSVCHRSDPLHGQYCVFCGGRTVSAVEQPAIPQGLVTTRPSQMLNTSPVSGSGEFPYTHVVQHSKPQSKSGSGSMAGTLVAAVLATVVGGGLGFGGMFLAKDALEPSLVQKLWPGEGLLLYTTVPDATVLVENFDQKSLYAGIASKNGTFTIASMPPGSYQAQVLDGSRAYKRRVVVENGKAAVIGYPSKVGARDE